MSSHSVPHRGDRKRVLAVGPGEGMTTGQASAFLAFARNSAHEISVVNTNDEGWSTLLRALSSIRVIVASAFRITFARPDCVYISTSRSRRGAIKDIAVIELAKLRRIPVVNHLQGSSFLLFRNALGPGYGKALDHAYESITASIVPHESLISHYSRYPRMAIRVVTNFVDAALEQSLQGASNRSTRPVKVLFLSNLMPDKGIFELILAAKAVASAFPGQLCLRIAGRPLPGRGMSVGDIKERLSTELSGVPNIEYCGVADLAKKAALLKWANVLALPSYMREEAVPLAVLEGMAAGCYLLVSDHGALPDLVKEVPAAVVPVRDITALERVLTQLIADPQPLEDARMRSPEIARARHSQTRYVQDIDQIVVEVCTETNR